VNLTRTEYGSMICDDDPGEPTTSVARISVTDQEAELLSFLARGKIVIELGTGLGVSTRALARTATFVWTNDVDPWVQDNVWPDLGPRVIGFTDRDGQDFADMVFIDGDHTTEATTADIEYALTLVKKGMIVVHDANMDSVREALVGPWHIVDTYHGMAICYVGWDA
jgi:hypothetical protein